ncbi:large ribosomal subunit protein mL66 [Planococcus citri]|uniref:large ribosomal subunit protein mL66 n=1 Tax=Planococcus citri TaxID=170843 RepID=UPI0031F83443
MLRNILTVNKFPSVDVIKRLPRNAIHTTAALGIKEIVEKKEGKRTIVEAVVKESGREPYIVKTEHDEYACPLCRLNMHINHTDVLILSQFVRSNGLMLPARITGLCRMQQVRMSKLVSMAHIAGLMPTLVPKYSKKDCFKKRRDWRKHNTYFEESTIMSWDPLYKDESGIKEKWYKMRGIDVEKFQPEPWKNKVDKIELQPKKLTFY